MREVLRIAIALIFILSGFVKAVDLKGFSFKLEEYFSPSVFNIPFLEQLALPLATVVVALELLLGFMLLIKLRLKPVLTTLIGLCVFFAFLTFYSAYFNKVTDCGCFGDAVKFTPWQSFTKDIVLLAALAVLWFWYRNYLQKLTPKSNIKYTALTVFSAIMALIMILGISHEPLIDFRDYRIGTNLSQERSKIEKDPDVYKTFYVLKNKQTGTEKKVNQDDYINDKTLWDTGSPWEIQSDKTSSEIVKKGYSSEIAKFRPEDTQGNDRAAELLSRPLVYLLCVYKPQALSGKKLSAAENFVKNKNPKAAVYGIAPQQGYFKTIPGLVMDATPIKTIARSNPFVLTLENGTITGKESLHDFMKRK